MPARAELYSSNGVRLIIIIIILTLMMGISDWYSIAESCARGEVGKYIHK